MISLETLLVWLGRTTWQVSLLILLVLLVQWALKNYLTPRWRYFLWFLVLARMAAPTLPESPFSLFNVLPEPERWTLIARTVPVGFSSSEKAKASEPDMGVPIGGTNRTYGTNGTDELGASATLSAPATQTAAQAAPAPPVAAEAGPRGGALAMLWGVGTLLFLAYIFGQSVATRVWYGKNRIVESTEVLEILEKCREEMGIRKTIKVVESPAQSSPALMGVWRPTLLLPAGIAGAIGRENLRFVFLHELAHVKRRDIWVNWLGTFLLALHWFNPLAWYALVRMRSDQELACDDTALRFTRPGESKRYGETVVRLLEGVALPQRLPGMAGILEDKSLMKRRIQMIVDFKKPGPAWTAVTVAVSLALGLSTLTERQTVAAESSSGTENQPASGERVVNFPEDRSIGVVGTLDWNEFDPDNLEPLGDAKGAVTAPEGKQLILFVQGDPEYLGELDPVGLQGLSLFDGRALGEEDMPLVGRLTGLRMLNLSDARLTDSGLSHLENLSSLKWLRIHKNDDITAEGISHLSGLVDIEHLLIRSLRDGDNAIQHIRKLGNLKELTLTSAGLTDPALAGLGDLAHLERLSLDRNPLTGSGLAFLAQLPSLKYLNLSETKVTDENLVHLVNLPSLEGLELQNTPIGDEGLRFLGKVHALKSLNLTGTHVTDEGLQHLSTLTSLQDFQFRNTEVTEAGLSLLDHLPFRGSGNPLAPKVGVIFSHYTAMTEYGGPGTFRAYREAGGIAKILKNLNVDLYAIIDPGTENESELVETLKELGLLNRILIGSDAESLKNLDVIAAKHVGSVRDEVLDAVIEAVQSGVGFVNRANFGGRDPGYDERIRMLLGIENGPWVWHGWVPAICTVISEHPILGFVEPGEEFMIVSSHGIIGMVDGTALLAAPEDYEPDYCPLFVRQLGEGRIVNMQWLEEKKPTPQLSFEDFYLRCINWAAKRPVGAKWTASSDLPEG